MLLSNRWSLSLHFTITSHCNQSLMKWVALALEFQLGAVALVSPFLNCFLSHERKEKEQTP